MNRILIKLKNRISLIKMINGFFFLNFILQEKLKKWLHRPSDVCKVAL